MKKYDVLIIGGGTAGITTAARIANTKHFKSIGIIEPSKVHYYQPLWTLVGNGLINKIETLKPMKSVIPHGTVWIQEKVIKITPEDNRVYTENGALEYKYLIVATGIIPDWSFAEGLKETIGKNGVASVYTYETADYTFETLKLLQKGRLIFTMPSGLLKCGGAPQKIMWLSEDFCSRLRDRKQYDFHFIKEGEGIFGIEKYKISLQKMVNERGINTHYHEKLVKVDGPAKRAYFLNTLTNEINEQKYDLLHVVPHFKTHSFIHESGLANEKGEIEVDQYTLQSTKFSNVFSLGDCSSCPTGKTGAAVRKEAPVLVKNLLSFDKGTPLTGKYNGYTACPILTRHNRVILAEFDYDGKPQESFPIINQAKESYLMYLFKRYLLPWLYWKLMLKGKI